MIAAAPTMPPASMLSTAIAIKICHRTGRLFHRRLKKFFPITALRLLHGPSPAAFSSTGGAASGQARQAQDTRRIAKSSRSEREYVLMILSPLYGFLKLENKRNRGAARELDA